MFAWGVTEVVRYSFYFFKLLGDVPRAVTWCRYTFFIALYPLGREFGVILGVQWVRAPDEDESVRVRDAERDQLFVSLAVGDDHVLPGIRPRFPDAIFVTCSPPEKEGVKGEERLMKRPRSNEPAIWGRWSLCVSVEANRRRACVGGISIYSLWCHKSYSFQRRRCYVPKCRVYMKRGTRSSACLFVTSPECKNLTRPRCVYMVRHMNAFK